MHEFRYHDNQLFCEDVDVDRLAAAVGTPFYLYSAGTLRRHFDQLEALFAELDPLVCFSAKACANLHVIETLVAAGAGVDVVSGGELYRALAAGADPAAIVFAGVGKSDDELGQAFDAGIGWLNVESEQEMEAASRIAAGRQQSMAVAVRVNPNVYDKATHPKAATGGVDSKFGVDISRVRELFARYGGDPHLQLRGLHVHLGSPIFSSAPYVAAIEKLLALVDELGQRGHRVEMIDIGGGFAANYGDREERDSWQSYAEDIVPLLRPFVAAGGRVVIEPGRSIVANAGALITRVQYTKLGREKRFVILDAGINHLIRPTLYDAYHFIWPTRPPAGLVPPAALSSDGLAGLDPYDVVGPICETGDYLARDRDLPAVDPGDLLCVFTAGAYGMTMASQYNSRPRPAEVLVDGDRATVVRRHESSEDLVAHERDPRPVKLDGDT